jgi:hypothetical protein
MHRKEVKPMSKAHLRYVKYALSTLASVGFAAKTS